MQEMELQNKGLKLEKLKLESEISMLKVSESPEIKGAKRVKDSKQISFGSGEGATIIKETL